MLWGNFSPNNPINILKVMEHIFVLFLCLSLLALTGSVRLYEETSKCGAVYVQLCPGGTKNEFSVVGCLQRELQSANPPVCLFDAISYYIIYDL